MPTVTKAIPSIMGRGLLKRYPAIAITFLVVTAFPSYDTIRDWHYWPRLAMILAIDALIIWLVKSHRIISDSECINFISFSKNCKILRRNVQKVRLNFDFPNKSKKYKYSMDFILYDGRVESIPIDMFDKYVVTSIVDSFGDSFDMNSRNLLLK